MDFIKSFLSFLQKKESLVQVSTSDDQLPQNNLDNTKDNVKEPNIIDLQNCTSKQISDGVSNFLNKKSCNAVDDVHVSDNTCVSDIFCDENHVNSNINEFINDFHSSSNLRYCDEMKNDTENVATYLKVDNDEMHTTDLEESLFNIDEISINTAAETNTAKTEFCDPVLNTDLAIRDNVVQKDDDYNGADGSDVFDLDEFYDLFETYKDMPLNNNCTRVENEKTVLSSDVILSKEDSCTKENISNDDQFQEVFASENKVTKECLCEFESVLDEYRIEKVKSVGAKNMLTYSTNTINDTSVLLTDSEAQTQCLCSESKEKSIELQEQTSINQKRSHTCSSKAIEVHISDTENKNDLQGAAAKDMLFGFVQIQPSTDKHIEANNSERNDKELQNDDKISIISINSSESLISIDVDINVTENFENIQHIDSESDCEGYHSSDFEFITESEAELDGLIINCTDKQLKTPKRDVKSQVYTLEIAREPCDLSSSQESLNNNVAGPSSAFNNNVAESSSMALQNQDPAILRSQYQRQRDYYIRLRQQHTIKEMHNSRENHVIPNDADYAGLFQGTFAPVGMDFYFVENKSVPPTISMNAPYRGLGFDVMMSRDELEEEHQYQDEAKESAKRILEMYPGPNRKRRRRH